MTPSFDDLSTELLLALSRLDPVEHGDLKQEVVASLGEIYDVRVKARSNTVSKDEATVRRRAMETLEKAQAAKRA